VNRFSGTCQETGHVWRSLGAFRVIVCEHVDRVSAARQTMRRRRYYTAAIEPDHRPYVPEQEAPACCRRASGFGCRKITWP